MSFGMVLAGIAGVICCLLSLAKWRFGLYGLLLYLPFAGMLSLISGQGTLALLAKDLVFVIPSYISFFLLNRKDSQKTSMPALMYIPMVVIALFVVFQSANPGIPNILVALIGAKVWLLYMPLAFMAGAAIESEEDLHRFLRFNVVLGLIPIALGLLQVVGIQTIGAESTAAAFYGSSSIADDNALFLNLGDYGSLYRVNSTFSAAGQYYTYTLALITMAATMAISDPIKLWRTIATGVLFLAVAAAFLSGARGAVIFVPIALVPIMLLSGRIGELIVLCIAVPALYVGLMTINGTDINMVLSDVGGFTSYYAEEYGWTRMIGVLGDNPLGAGTGMNTSAARYAFGIDAVWNGVEGYYLKTAYELSALALPAVVLMLWLPIVEGIKLTAGRFSKEVRRCGAGLTGFFVFVALLSGRAWPLDVDPVSVYFWVLVGVLFKLHRISGISATEFEEEMVSVPESRLPAFASVTRDS